jgi:hypothetical protein
MQHSGKEKSDSNERYHRFWSIFFPLHVISYMTIVLLKLG